MKHILSTVLLLLCFAFNSLAQVESGSMFLRGTFSISSESFESGASNITQLQIAPYFGYFLSDGLAVGAGVGYSSFDGQNFSSSGIFVSPFIRKYITVGDNGLFFFAQGSFNANFEKNNGNSVNSFGINFSPGFAYFLSEKWALEFSTNVLGLNVRNPEGDNNNSTRLNLGLSTFSPAIGVAFYF